MDFSILESISENIKIIDKNHRVIYTNNVCAGCFDIQANEVLGEPCYKAFFGNTTTCAHCVSNDVMVDGKPRVNRVEMEIMGNKREMEINCFPLRDASGAVQYVLEILRDMTDHDHALLAGHHFSNIISNDPAMEKVFRLIDKVATTDSTVMIRGETGTGKELVARAIHQRSKRKGERFVALNCSALTDSLLESELFGHERGSFTGADQSRVGKFELAHGGTIFLDEIGDISQTMQVKMLRVLQEKEFERVGSNEVIKVDIRIICATNRNLEKAIEEGTFRRDLYYRINVVPINLPPLRERKGDIPLLAKHFVNHYAELFHRKIRGFDQSAIDIMLQYAWPGNIRELENAAERAVILADENSNIGPDLLPFFVRVLPELDLNLSLKDYLARMEKKYLEEELRRFQGSIQKTADQAGLDTRSIHRKMSEHGLDKKNYK